MSAYLDIGPWRVICAHCGFSDGAEFKKLGDALRAAKAIARCAGCGKEDRS